MKKLLLLMALAAVAPVGPAFAQETTGQEETAGQTVTGEIERPGITTYMYGTHAISDEASGTFYALRSEEEGLLDGYVESRVTVYGASVPGYENGAVEGGPPLLNVSRVEPAGPTEPDVDLNEDGAVNEADGEFAIQISDTARDASKGTGQPVLPATGGFPVLLLGAAAPLLLVTGLLARPR